MTPFLQQTRQAYLERSVRLGRIPAPRRAKTQPEPEPVVPEPVEIVPEPAPVPATFWPFPIPIRIVARRVAERYEITFEEIVGTRRTNRVVRPRHVAMYLARTVRNASLPEIGRHFGNKDHTTVLNAIRRAEQRMAADHVLRDEVTALECELRAAMAKPVEAA